MKVAVFSRVAVCELDSERSLDLATAVALTQAQSKYKAKDPRYTHLRSVIGPERRPCMFIAGDGWAMDVDRRCDRIRVVYWFMGFVELPDELLIGTNDRDLDFAGFVEEVVNSDGSRSIAFRGTQDDCFALVAEIGILAEKEFCGAGARNDAIIWDTPHRVEVETTERFPVIRVERNQLQDGVIIGEGHLIWHPNERRTDRYGSIKLTTTPNDFNERIPLLTSEITGSTGSLVAEIVVAKPCDDITGDSYRRIFPTPVRNGELFWLGSGRMFADDAYSIGCQPFDGRAVDWLNPRALYCCKAQFVRLHFLPIKGQE